MAISFNQVTGAATLQQYHSRLPADGQTLSAPAISQSSQATQTLNKPEQALTGRPLESPGSNTETNHVAGGREGKSTAMSTDDKSNEAKLSEAEKRQLAELRARDRQVRAHEQAHLGAAGGLANGGASFTTQRGPDGQLYAVGGEVSIDTSTVSDDPTATIQKAQQIRRAALAPADPSAQDLAIAAQATLQEQEARAELAAQRAEDANAATPANHEQTSDAVHRENQSNEYRHNPETVYYAIDSQSDKNPTQQGSALDLFA